MRAECSCIIHTYHAANLYRGKIKTDKQEKGIKRLFCLFGVEHQPHQAREVKRTESMNK